MKRHKGTQYCRCQRREIRTEVAEANVCIVIPAFVEKHLQTEFVHETSQSKARPVASLRKQSHVYTDAPERTIPRDEGPAPHTSTAERRRITRQSQGAVYRQPCCSCEEVGRDKHAEWRNHSHRRVFRKGAYGLVSVEVSQPVAVAVSASEE